MTATMIIHYDTPYGRSCMYCASAGEAHELAQLFAGRNPTITPLQYFAITVFAKSDSYTLWASSFDYALAVWLVASVTASVNGVTQPHVRLFTGAH